MRFALHGLSISPPGAEMNKKGFGWSQIFIHLHDEEIDTFPNVTIEASVPYSQDHTYRQGREAALERAKAMLRAALEALDKTSLAEIDKVRSLDGE
jgi:hypothetical protein